jgi:hypothetical protein
VQSRPRGLQIGSVVREDRFSVRVIRFALAVERITWRDEVDRIDVGTDLYAGGSRSHARGSALLRC